MKVKLLNIKLKNILVTLNKEKIIKHQVYRYLKFVFIKLFYPEYKSILRPYMKRKINIVVTSFRFSVLLTQTKENKITNVFVQIILDSLF